MSAGNKRLLERWPREIARGRTSFVLREALRFCAYMIPLVWLASWALGWEDRYPWGDMPSSRIVRQLILFPVAGLLAGWATWAMNNRGYRILTGSDAASGTSGDPPRRP